jgi:hypothetical protein
MNEDIFPWSRLEHVPLELRVNDARCEDVMLSAKIQHREKIHERGAKVRDGYQYSDTPILKGFSTGSDEGKRCCGDRHIDCPEVDY